MRKLQSVAISTWLTSNWSATSYNPCRDTFQHYRCTGKNPPSQTGIPPQSTYLWVREESWYYSCSHQRDQSWVKRTEADVQEVSKWIQKQEEARLWIQATQGRKGIERCATKSDMKSLFGILVQFPLREQRKRIYANEEKWRQVFIKVKKKKFLINYKTKSHVYFMSQLPNCKVI